MNEDAEMTVVYDEALAAVATLHRTLSLVPIIIPGGRGYTLLYIHERTLDRIARDLRVRLEACRSPFAEFTPAQLAVIEALELTAPVWRREDH